MQRWDDEEQGCRTLPQRELKDDVRCALKCFIKEHMFGNGGGSFTEYLQNLIIQKGMKSVEVYTRANLTKQYFSKLMNGRVNPTKDKLLCIAVALHLDLDETKTFLNMGGYALSPYNKTDLVFQYYICHHIFDVFSIDIALHDLGLPSLLD